MKLSILDIENKRNEAYDALDSENAELAIELLEGIFNDGIFPVASEIGGIYELRKEYTNAIEWYQKRGES